MSTCKISSKSDHFWRSYGYKTNKILSKIYHQNLQILISFFTITPTKMVRFWQNFACTHILSMRNYNKNEQTSKYQNFENLKIYLKIWPVQDFKFYKLSIYKLSGFQKCAGCLSTIFFHLIRRWEHRAKYDLFCAVILERIVVR